MTGSEPARVLARCPFCDKLNRVDLRRAADRPKCGDCGRPMLLDRPVKVADRDFERIIAESDVPVLVDFYADWCGPCKVMAPLFDEVARERMGTIYVVKVDTDRSPEAAQRHGITGIPTLIAFHRGREVAREIGAVPRPRLDALVKKVLA